jgi:hypothetical protein
MAAVVDVLRCFFEDLCQMPPVKPGSTSVLEKKIFKIYRDNEYRKDHIEECSTVKRMFLYVAHVTHMIHAIVISITLVALHISSFLTRMVLVFVSLDSGLFSSSLQGTCKELWLLLKKIASLMAALVPVVLGGYCYFP